MVVFIWNSDLSVSHLSCLYSVYWLDSCYGSIITDHWCLLSGVDEVTGSSGDGEEESQLVIILAATNYPWNIDEALKRRLE